MQRLVFRRSCRKSPWSPPSAQQYPSCQSQCCPPFGSHFIGCLYGQHLMRTCWIAFIVQFVTNFVRPISFKVTDLVMTKVLMQLMVATKGNNDENPIKGEDIVINYWPDPLHPGAAEVGLRDFLPCHVIVTIMMRGLMMFMTATGWRWG